MCLAVLALGQHDRFPVVLAANRDEFFERPAHPLDWWQPAGHEAPVLGGRDLSAGGTWFALSRRGRLGLLTNIRNPGSQRPDAPSRGQIVPDWLGTDQPLERASTAWQQAGHNGFNLIAADLRQDQWAWVSSHTAAPQPMTAGWHGLSNASLDTPWPKVLRLRDAIRHQLANRRDLASLVMGLFDALIDPTRACDEHLPATGVPLELERALSAVFIRTPDGRYGTRCSTVLVQERDPHHGLLTHVFERTYHHAHGEGELAHVTLAGAMPHPWPAPIRRWAQVGCGYRTTLSSTFTNSSAA